MANDVSNGAGPTPPRRSRRGGLTLYVAGIVLLAAAAGGGLMMWQDKKTSRAEAMEVQSAEAARGPRVDIVKVEQGPNAREVTLLGDARPFAAVTLYGKVGGYLKTITVDKGDSVKAGQVIAEIESAETDSQYNSAVADLENKRRLSDRSRQLVARQFVSVETAQTADTNVRMAEAKVAELGTMKSYEILRAPFAGTVTARFVDPGALIQNAVTNQSSNQPIVTLVDGSHLRIYAHLEQQDAPFIHLGDDATVGDAANPTRLISAKVSRTAGELDPTTRTLLVEVDLDNSQGYLLPGSFVNVTLKIPTVGHPRIPAGALVMRGVAPFVAAVGNDDRIHFQAVHVASTDGNTVNIADGAAVGERLAVNLPSTVAEGGRIQPVVATAAR